MATGECVSCPPDVPRSPFQGMEGCVMFPASFYDPETLNVLTRAFDEAWTDIQTMIGSKPLNASAFRSTLAKRIMAAAARGERDPKRLKLIALGAV